MDPLGPCLSAALFLFLSAAVFAVNAALPSLDEGELKKEAEHGSNRSARLQRLLERYDSGRGELWFTYAVTLAAACASLWALLGPALTAWSRLSGLLCALLFLALFAIAAIALTALIPGGIAARFPTAALALAAPAEWTIAALTPVTRGAWLLSRLILMPFKLEPATAAEHVSEEEILQMVDIGEEKGAIETDEKEMIENIFEFNNMNAGDCMIHRKDITALEADADDDEVMQQIIGSGLSRFPVYEGSIDNIIGIVTARDFLIDRCSDAPKPFRSLIRPAHFVPESIRTDVLFREMQTRKQHMAIVIDEYGGTSGLITLEDLLEEIVGNIYDEYDPKEVEDITPLPDGRWRVSGSTELDVLGEALGVDLPSDEDYDTLGGLVFSHLTEIPADGSRPVVECCGLRISVTEVADRRVEWAIVEKLPEDEDGSEENAGKE